MATVSYTIYSHYDPPKEPAAVDAEVSLENPDASNTDSEAEWPKIRRPLAPPPVFVPATITSSYWDIDNADSSSQSTSAVNNLQERHEGTVASWYRSLLSTKLKSEESGKASNSRTASASSGIVSRDSSSASSASTSQSTSRSLTPTTSSTTLAPKNDSHTPFTTLPRQEKKDKNNWFILNALRNETSTPPAPAPTLADILERDPPPLPTEERFKPPVFLAIGPSNRGFAMLSRTGWNEGEPLGPDEVRKRYGSSTRTKRDLSLELEDDEVYQKRIKPSRKGKEKEIIPNAGVKKEIVEADLGGDDEIVEMREVDVIDLTLSDSDSDIDVHRPDPTDPGDAERTRGKMSLKPDLGVRATAGDGEGCETVQPVDSSSHSEYRDEDVQDSSRYSPRTTSDPQRGDSTDAESVVTKLSAHLRSGAAYERKALITPLATVLKSDRLGIGLKAKTVGPYKASQKRITHNAAALALHIRQSEEMRKKKRMYGRGKRGFDRHYKQEESTRQQMLSYLNS
ncbi:hypothetical protein AX16_008048 [Volvariella volvacea WC 439]|nr:hypothetical protein AX16_008048 [Volvariella volvacea WC 439]